MKRQLTTLFSPLLLLTLTFTSTSVHATNYLLNQPSCVNVFSGIWTPAGIGTSDNCTVTDFLLLASDTLTVLANAELLVNGSSANDGILDIHGDLINEGDFENRNLLVVFGSGEIRNYVALTNSTAATINNTGSILNIDATISNQGALSNSGSSAVILSRNASALVINTGTLVNANDALVRIAQGTLENNGLMTNESQVEIMTADAVFNNAVGATLDNQDTGLIRNEGQMTNRTGSNLNNNGGVFLNAFQFFNYDDANVLNRAQGLIVNFGAFENGTAGVITNRAQIFNNLTIDNYCRADFFNVGAGGIFNALALGMTNHDGNLVNTGGIFAPVVNAACLDKP